MKSKRPSGLYRRYGKRVFDICFSLACLFMLSPLLIVTALVSCFALGSPILFVQKRPGKDGVPFDLIKFRSMLMVNDEKKTDSERLTRYGKLLRNTSIDELPELWNILRGDMSFVGPRPLLMEYLDRYSEEQRKRHNVRPGLTGLAQVNGRNLLSWNKKFELDVEYVYAYCFLFDMKILLKTFALIVSREGISAQGEATMPVFEGGARDEAKHDN